MRTRFFFRVIRIIRVTRVVVVRVTEFRGSEEFLMRYLRIRYATIEYVFLIRVINVKVYYTYLNLYSGPLDRYIVQYWLSKCRCITV